MAHVTSTHADEPHCRNGCYNFPAFIGVRDSTLSLAGNFIPARTLFDTGSEVNLVSRSFVKLSGLETQLRKLSCPRSICSVQNTEFWIDQELIVDWYFDKRSTAKTINLSLVDIPGDDIDVLIGGEFLHKHRILVLSPELALKKKFRTARVFTAVEHRAPKEALAHLHEVEERERANLVDSKEAELAEFLGTSPKISASSPNQSSSESANPTLVHRDSSSSSVDSSPFSGSSTYSNSPPTTRASSVTDSPVIEKSAFSLPYNNPKAQDSQTTLRNDEQPIDSHTIPAQDSIDTTSNVDALGVSHSPVQKPTEAPPHSIPLSDTTIDDTPSGSDHVISQAHTEPPIEKANCEKVDAKQEVEKQEVQKLEVEKKEVEKGNITSSEPEKQILPTSSDVDASGENRLVPAEVKQDEIPESVAPKQVQEPKDKSINLVPNDTLQQTQGIDLESQENIGVSASIAPPDIPPEHATHTSTQETQNAELDSKGATETRQVLDRTISQADIQKLSDVMKKRSNELMEIPNRTRSQSDSGLYHSPETIWRALKADDVEDANKVVHPEESQEEPNAARGTNKHRGLRGLMHLANHVRKVLPHHHKLFHRHNPAARA